MKKSIVVLAAAALFAAGCGSSGGAHSTSAAPAVDNPWFPLRPGTTYVYTGEKDHKPDRDVVTVTHATKVINGVRCTAVRDLLYERGKLAERTTDWYAQDRAGNVWYYGEDTAELASSGKVTSTEGTWQAGVHGARAGIYMPAQPRVGSSATQEYYRGHAEDHFKVLSLNASVQSPAAVSAHALLTMEWTPLEPGVIDHKLYVRGIGVVKEQTIRGGSELAVLQSVSRD